MDKLCKTCHLPIVLDDTVGWTHKAETPGHPRFRRIMRRCVKCDWTGFHNPINFTCPRCNHGRLKDDHVAEPE